MTNQARMFLRGSIKSTGNEVDALLVERTRDRLALVAGLIAVIALLAMIVVHFAPGSQLDDTTDRVGRGNITLLLQFGSSVLLAVLAVRKLIPVRALLLVGVVYEIWICWNSSLGASRSALVDTGILPWITFTEVFIVFFPLIVPSKPRLTVAAAMLSAMTRPLAAMLVYHKQGIPLPEGWLLSTTIAPIITVGMALIGARVVYGLGVSVVKAKRMGSYHLEDLLGKGGMGEVWRARHELLARPAAVKLINPGLAGADSVLAARALGRFEREAQATALLQSPHTVKLFDFGRADDGTFYYVMELLQGVDLNELVKRFGPVVPERALYFALGACHSLAEAHAVNLAHRDIKPANLMACKSGLDHDVIKVLDFGLVAPTQRKETDQRLTVAGGSVGTPAFISPEAARGDPIDHRADIYAIGCLLFWLLAGRLVFEEETAMALAVAHASKPPPPLADLCEEELPDGLVEIVEACLAKEPDERPQNAAELADSLRALHIEQPWSPKRALRWWERHRPLERSPDGQTRTSNPSPPGRSRS